MTKTSEPSIDDLMNAGEYRKAFEAMRKERDEWKHIAQTETEPLFSQRVLVPQLTKERDAAVIERDEFKAARDRAAATNYDLREKLELAVGALEKIADYIGTHAQVVACNALEKLK